MSPATRFSVAIGWLLVSAVCSRGAILVAAVDSLPQEKSRADLICDGTDDQVELAKSLAMGRRGKTKVDVDPKTQQTVECTLNHAVEWLPGNYHLSGTLEVPSAANCVIRAEGTTLHYQRAEGDCVVIRGMNRCRYSFGTIESASSGAALCVRPAAEIPALMSFVNFTGLVGKDARGTGLLLDPTRENICVNRFEGTDVLGFERGVFVGAAGTREGAASSHGKCDTNWFWLSYVRMCSTCIEESAGGVDSSVWNVNVDASLPGATAIRTAGAYSKWYIIMGTYTFEKKNMALVLEPGARHSVFEMHPPLDDFAWEDRSGSDTNVILSTNSPPHRRLSELRPGPPASAR
ncbi:MAG: hypothetical protein WD738_10320 [Pirellulales bacterium]